MAAKRKRPKLRQKGNCFVTDIYKPDGSRTTISFGPPDVRTEGEIYAAFGQWLDLFNKQPQKILGFSDPYEAIAKTISPTTICTVGQFLDKYVEAVEQHLPPLRDGRMNPTLIRMNQIKPFLDPYADWPAADFGPDELKKIQDAMVAHQYFRQGHEDEPIGYTRLSINQMINEIHRMWRWGNGREITTEAQGQRLKEVRPLRIGRSMAKDNLKRAPVTEDELERVTHGLTCVTADMLRLIWITAMRPSEVCRMRPFDILREDKACWLYIPGRDAGLLGDHKTAHFQRIRAVPLPSKAQAILKPRVTDFKSKSCIFSPAQAVQELLDRRAAKRKTPLKYGNSPGTNRTSHPMIVPGDEYSSQTFNVAVGRACIRAGVERFTPYDLRRTAATRIRSLLSKDDARLMLGHVSSDTTEIYLLEEVQEAVKVAKQLDAHEG